MLDSFYFVANKYYGIIKSINNYKLTSINLKYKL